MDLLKLVALDRDDLTVISMHLQDAIVRVGDIAYLPKERCFAIVARRFDWEAGPDQPPQRRLTGMHFQQVKAVRVRGIDQTNRDAVLNLLAISFEEKDPPSGTATLIFAEGGAIQVDVDCIEMQMKDLGPVWAAESRPAHGETSAEPI
ncbi:DUF2948 family protein [Microvirga thermotolerans]|uniref:DUF2948 family protein n=1 Tax=Microvirga thermotolerans TaxID=2651334 RepID=A0A5P9JVF6_9HYPH|nr:DUF2948 family protein [Microvirga thermotolerans]QFU15636.1 DUF2948 family protein [Microvirga thermotolerans]